MAKLPSKEAESIPCDRLSVDLIGSYKTRREILDDPLILKVLTMIDPANGLFEIVCYNDKQAYTIANLVNQTCLYIYSGSTIIMYGRGNEFLGHEMTE